MAIPRQRIHLPPHSFGRAAAGLVSGSLWDGDAMPRFEAAFAEAVGAGHAVAVPSGRAALASILQRMDLTPEDEVICPAFGYPVVPHLVRMLGFQLRFAEIEPDQLGFDPGALDAAITDRTRVVIATHLYGVPCRMREIREICDRRGVRIVEDCAHCFGASVDGRHVGTLGYAGYFSFETSKMINTLGGGMITTDDAALASSIREHLAAEDPKTLGWLRKRLMKTTFEATVTSSLPFNLGVYPALRFASRGDSGERFASGYQSDHFTMAGRTGRYTNYQAVLGLDQLGRAAAEAKTRAANAERIMGQLRDRVRFQTPAEGCSANYMLLTARFRDRPAMGRELLRRGIDTKHHYMRDCARALETGESFPEAEAAEAEVLHLPAFPGLKGPQLDRVASAVRAAADAVGEPAPTPVGPQPVVTAGAREAVASGR